MSDTPTPTPTPRTSDIWGGFIFTYPFLAKAVDETALMERELAAVTEQRDRLAEELKEANQELEFMHEAQAGESV